MKDKFSAWANWSKRNRLARLCYPGIYALALSEDELAGTAFSWRMDVIYIGMTNAKGGLKSRLQQFENTIKGGNGHGGGQRFRFKYRDFAKIKQRLYVSVYPHQCDVDSNKPSDLRTMGRVAKNEYDCFATFVEKFRRLPEFNDKKRSPKK